MVLSTEQLQKLWYQVEGDDSPHTLSKPMEIGSGNSATAVYQQKWRCAFGCTVLEKDSVNRWTTTFSTKAKGSHPRIHHCDEVGNLDPRLESIANAIWQSVEDGDWQEVVNLRQQAQSISAALVKAKEQRRKSLADGNARRDVRESTTEVQTMSNQTQIVINGQLHVLVPGTGFVPVVGGTATSPSLDSRPAPIAAPAQGQALAAPQTKPTERAGTPSRPAMTVFGQAEKKAESRKEKEEKYKILLEAPAPEGWVNQVVENTEKGGRYYNTGKIGRFGMSNPQLKVTLSGTDSLLTDTGQLVRNVTGILVAAGMSEADAKQALRSAAGL